MTVSNSSPNVDNYYVGKGIIKWKADGEETYRDVGNVPTFEFTPTVEKLDHFSSRAGIRVKDRSIVRQKSATIKMVMEEITAANLAMVLMGSIADAEATPISIDVFALSEIHGAIRFVGQNEIGAKIQMDFPRVTLQPSAAISPISDEWGQIEVSGEVTADPDTGSFGTVLWNISEEVA